MHRSFSPALAARVSRNGPALTMCCFRARTVNLNNAFLYKKVAEMESDYIFIVAYNKKLVKFPNLQFPFVLLLTVIFIITNRIKSQ